MARTASVTRFLRARDAMTTSRSGKILAWRGLSAAIAATRGVHAASTCPPVVPPASPPSGAGVDVADIITFDGTAYELHGVDWTKSTVAVVTGLDLPAVRAGMMPLSADFELTIECPPWVYRRIFEQPPRDHGPPANYDSPLGNWSATL